MVYMKVNLPVASARISITASKNRNVVMTKSMLFQLNVGHKDATVS